MVHCHIYRENGMVLDGIPLVLDTFQNYDVTTLDTTELSMQYSNKDTNYIYVSKKNDKLIVKVVCFYICILLL